MSVLRNTKLVWTTVLVAASLAFLGGGAIAASENSNVHDVIMRKSYDVAADLDTPEEALAAGYHPEPFCIPGMGVHWVKPSAMDDKLEWREPEVLLFLPDSSDASDVSGDTFLGIEYVVLTQDGAHNSTHTVPRYHGVPLYGPMPGHSPTMPWHTEIHIYLAPGLESDGTFPQTRAGIVCPAGTTPPGF